MLINEHCDCDCLVNKYEIIAANKKHCWPKNTTFSAPLGSQTSFGGNTSKTDTQTANLISPHYDGSDTVVSYLLFYMAVSVNGRLQFVYGRCPSAIGSHYLIRLYGWHQRWLSRQVSSFCCMLTSLSLHWRLYISCTYYSYYPNYDSILYSPLTYY